MVTCRLTACTPGSAPGPTLGIEYGKPLPLPYHTMILFQNDRTTTLCGSERSRYIVAMEFKFKFKTEFVGRLSDLIEEGLFIY